MWRGGGAEGDLARTLELGRVPCVISYAFAMK